ncbi:tetratricopeptide repeat protein [Streptomyces sp. NPDC006700]|uniref:tetratricopeptide repeat protein n=1 Tax=Streptomyces sp. NPDC006700 TaxID=3154479 RepID=UPI0033C31949
MHQELSETSRARLELHKKLSDGLARSRASITQLARRAGLGRTTVQAAFSSNAAVPSARTVAALAKALKLPVDELGELQRRAAGNIAVPTASNGSGESPGQPINCWEPHDLEVHPAGPIQDALGARSSARPLSGYVRRQHDRHLADAVRDAAEGRSRMLVLVGSSSTGKTRACWEAVQPLASQGWLLWHPFDPTRAEAALEDLQNVRPRTVVWLNEAQHYLGDTQFGERIAAALHALLTQPARGPVLVLGTLWDEFATKYTRLPAPGGPDPHSRVRELLADRLLTVPETFDAQALADAAVHAEDGDRLLTDALTRAHEHGRVTQELAGAPELLHRYRHGTPAARAVLEAAMDARRLGVGLHLPQAFLIDAAPDYLSDTDYHQLTLTPDWAEAAFAELARPVHGKQAPLRRVTLRPQHRPPGIPPTVHGPVTGTLFQLADYLEQHGRTTRRLCPPSSFWHAAYAQITHSNDLTTLARAARARHRLQWAYHLFRQAADMGDTGATIGLAEMRAVAGDWDGAEALYRQAADNGHANALIALAGMWETLGDREGAEVLYREAADNGDPAALMDLARVREDIGDRDGAEVLYREAADNGHPAALFALASMRWKAGDRGGAEALHRQIADNGDPDAMIILAKMRDAAGDRDGAEALYRQAADNGDILAIISLAQMREEAGDRDDAEALCRRAADESAIAMFSLAQMRDRAGDQDGAEALYRQAADNGDIPAMLVMAQMREESGDRDDAEAFYRQAADNGSTDAIRRLAAMREKAGDPYGAEALYRQAADNGNSNLNLRALWPYGLEPDGTPTLPWE